MNDFRDKDVCLCEECEDEHDLYACDCQMELCEYCIHEHAASDCDPKKILEKYYE